jgi:hypothetical protein
LVWGYNTSLIKWIGSGSSSSVFENVLMRIGVNSSLNASENSYLKQSVPEFT